MFNQIFFLNVVAQIIISIILDLIKLKQKFKQTAFIAIQNGLCMF